MTQMNTLLRTDRPAVMGILNVTPDSFSDGGRHNSVVKAHEQAKRMIDEGVDIIDVGGESTRPGAPDVSLEEELERVIPVIESIANLGKPVSIDTSKPEVMTRAIAAGASIINDVRALREPGAIEAASQSGAVVCLMHMQGEPRTMQQAPQYTDVTQDVLAFLQERINECVKAGIPTNKIWVDPGFGFGKTLEHNLTLMRELEEFNTLEVPILVGVSRKSMFGKITGKEVNQRLAASLAGALIAAQNGAHILRVHDVAETVDVLNVFAAVNQ